MKSLRRSLLKVVVFVPLAIIASILAIGGAGIVSLSTATRIGVHSLHSFWPCIPAAVCLQLIRKRANPSLIALAGAFLFVVLVNIAAAIGYIGGYMDITSGMPLANQSMDILDTSLTGLILAIAFLPRLSNKKCSSRCTILGMLLLIGIPLIVYAAGWFLLFSIASQEAIIVAGVFSGILGTGVFSILTVISLLRRINSFSIDQGYFGSATLLTAVSLVLFLVSITSVPDVWIYAENLQVAALLLYGLSLAIPYLRRAGFSRALSYLLILGFSIFTYLPLTITISVEAALLVVEVNPSNIIAFGIIHLGASFLSGMIAILLYNYSRRKPTRSLFPLAMLYAVWTFVAISAILVEAFRNVVTTGEPIVSYLVGSIITLAILLYTWLVPATESADMNGPSPKRVLASVVALGSLILVGEVTNILILEINPGLVNSQIGNAMLFGTNLLVLLFLLSKFFAYSEHARGRATIEISMLLYLSVWIVPNILKSYYMNWSAGWWISQLMVFIGLLVGPALLGLLYIRALQETEESHMRARLYADLLMHDVSNYHQMLLTSLELMGDDMFDTGRRHELSKEAKKVVSLADQLIANVRLMGQTEEITPAKLKPINLVSIVVDALDEVMEGIGSEAIEFQYMPETNHAPVLGDKLLKHAFINILMLAIQQPHKKNRIEVTISREDLGGKTWWKATLIVPGEWTGYERIMEQSRMDSDGYSGTILGMLVARLIVTSFDGRLMLRAAEDIVGATEFTVLLPSLEESEF
ncbi:MAG: sensor histidine kinase [Candidatus Thorarchaeota archaeon]|nr:sensor histidine kinase [Candidatus Thorarchaeota archaeon]